MASLAKVRALRRPGAFPAQVPVDPFVHELRPVGALSDGSLAELIPLRLGDADTGDERLTRGWSWHGAEPSRAGRLSAISRGDRHGVSVATKTLVINHCVWRHGRVMCGDRNEARNGSTHRRQILADATAVSDRNNQTRCPAMTVATFPASRPVLEPIVAICRACSRVFTAYGPHDGLCPRLACTDTSTRHGDLADVPASCWAPNCADEPTQVVEWCHRGQGPRRETTCCAHVGDAAVYAEDTSDGFTPVTVSRLPVTARTAVAA